jgi:uncharacterized protein YcfL
MNNQKYWSIAALIACGTMCLTGCMNTSGTVVRTDHQSGASSIISDNVRLAHQVKVVNISYDELNGLKRVNISLASDRNRRLRVDYRICWYDKNGIEIDPNTKTYRNLILEGHDTVSVTGVANSPAAIMSKLRVRETSQAE